MSKVQKQEADDEITFSELEIDRTCRAGEEGWFRGPPGRGPAKGGR